MKKYSIISCLFVIQMHYGVAQVFIQEVNNSNLAKYDAFLRIKHGSPAVLTDVPYQVSFKRLRKGTNLASNFCGGSLIKADKILSAAHCFAENKKCCGFQYGHTMRKTANILAVMGNLNNVVNWKDENLTGQSRYLRRSVVANDYRFPRNDIAVVAVEKPFDLNNEVKIIPFATVNKDYVGTCLIAGFGRTESGLPSSVLLIGSTILASATDCHKDMGKNARGLICATQHPQDTLKGDSGGPLVCKGTKEPAEDGSLGLLVGVTSGSNRRITFFTKVAYHHAFVTEQMSRSRHDDDDDGAVRTAGRGSLGHLCLLVCLHVLRAS